MATAAKSTMTEFGHIRQDGVTDYQLGDDAFQVTRETRKKPDGSVMETGVTKREAVYKATAAQLRDGGGVLSTDGEGEAIVLAEVRIVERYMTQEQVAAERDAERLKKFTSNLRKRLGISKSKQPVAQRDKITVGDLREFVLGNKTLMNQAFDALPPKVQADVQKVLAEASKTKVKPATPTETMLAMAEQMRAAGALTPELEEQVNAVLERQRKAKAAKAVPAAPAEVTAQPQATA